VQHPLTQTSSIKMAQQYARIMNKSIANDMANVDAILKGV